MHISDGVKLYGAMAGCAVLGGGMAGAIGQWTTLPENSSTETSGKMALGVMLFGAMPVGAAAAGYRVLMHPNVPGGSPIKGAAVAAGILALGGASAFGAVKLSAALNSRPEG